MVKAASAYGALPNDMGGYSFNGAQTIVDRSFYKAFDEKLGWVKREGDVQVNRYRILLHWSRGRGPTYPSLSLFTVGYFAYEQDD
jgi:hypothetical protein